MTATKKRKTARSVKVPVELFVIEIYEANGKRRLVRDEAGQPRVMNRSSARIFTRGFASANREAIGRAIRVYSLACAAPVRGRAGAV